ncbi:MAG TPA: septum formation initiator family protein [Jatrophihabitans sp.]|jgi:cell division protein FtsB
MSKSVTGRDDGVKLRMLTIRRPQLTGRTMMIAAMSLFLVVILASPLQTYLTRRETMNQAVQQEQDLKARVEQLQQERDQWNDPAFVQRQARARLQYIRPGDTLYTVLNPDGTPRSSTSGTSTAVQRSGHRPSWNSTLWGSVQDSDKAQ